MGKYWNINLKLLLRATIVVDNLTHTCNERLLVKYLLVISRKPLGGEVSPGKVVRVFHGQASWCSDIGQRSWGVGLENNDLPSLVYVFLRPLSILLYDFIRNYIGYIKMILLQTPFKHKWKYVFWNISLFIVK